jgi:hypothetical protein
VSVPEDYVDRLLRDWAQQRPDLDFSPVAPPPLPGMSSASPSFAPLVSSSQARSGATGMTAPRWIVIGLLLLLGRRVTGN